MTKFFSINILVQFFMGMAVLQQMVNALIMLWQAVVIKIGADSFGNMGNMNIGNWGRMNPAGMMTGMIEGGAMCNQIAGMLNNMGLNKN